MKLRKLILVEVTLVTAVVISLVALIEVTSYLSSSQNDSVGLYIEKEFAEGNVSVVPRETAIVRFNYTSYEPAILVLELTFRSWESPGYLIVRCNNKQLRPILADPAKPNITLHVVSVSGVEWVEPMSSMFGMNEVTFQSAVENGFEGNLGYRIKLRGSR